MRHRGLCWGLALAVVATIGVGCASRNGGQAAGGSAAMRREADEFKAQAQQGLRDFAREKPAPPPCEVGYLTGRELTVLATSEWIERAGLRRGDRITSVDGVPASQLHNQPRPSARVPPGTPFSVGVSRAGREVTLTLICIPRPEVWIAARRTQGAAAQGDWAGCQAAALDYILAVGYMESLALEFHGRCGFHKAMMRGERFTLDLARDLYDWQSFRVREKSYEPGGLDEIRESVLGAVAVLRREGFRDYADRLEEQLRTAPARVAAEIAAAPAPAIPSPSSVAQARPSTSAVPPPTSPQITPIAPPVPTSPAVSAPSQATSPPAPTPPAPTPPLTSASPPPVQRGSAPPQPSAPPRVSQGTA